MKPKPRIETPLEALKAILVYDEHYKMLWKDRRPAPWHVRNIPYGTWLRRVIRAAKRKAKR